MSVFLSYRRSDSDYALWIYPSLIQWFGPDRVFWDRKNIAPGADFAATIYEQIRSSDSPDDWIHRETAVALSEKLVVVPVLVGGMRAPKEGDLPPALRPLSKLQALSASDMIFHDLLRERLEKVLPISAFTDENNVYHETFRSNCCDPQ